MKTRAGFIFLMTLLTTVVISLLVLTSMQHILLYYKALNALESQHQQFYQLEDLARKLAKAKRSELDANCLVYQDAANQVIERLKKHQGCVFHGNYQYLVEELGDFPCLVVHDKHGKQATHHRRVSLLRLGDDNSPDSLIQLRHIEAINALSCDAEELEVSVGISSWRYFAGV